MGIYCVSFEFDAQSSKTCDGLNYYKHNSYLHHPVSICKEIIQQDINQLMEIIGFTNEICNW